MLLVVIKADVLTLNRNPVAGIPAAAGLHSAAVTQVTPGDSCGRWHAGAMCGRYVMARAVGDLLAEFDAGLEEEIVIPPSWNVAPTADVPILLERLVDGSPVRQLHVARWGLVPSWAKDPAIGSKMINARSESVLEKPAFRKATRSRRCAVPADGYYEWKGEGRSKQPYYVHPKDGRRWCSPGCTNGGRIRPRPRGTRSAGCSRPRS